MPPAETAGNRPLHEIRHRNIRAAIWTNETANGPMHTVTITRGYKDGDQWKDSHSFGYDELTIVAKLMYDAHSFITQLRAQARVRQPAPPAEPRPRGKKEPK